VKKLLAIGFLVFSLTECYQSNYSRAGRMPLWKRGGIATTSVVGNAVMGGLLFKGFFDYLIKDSQWSSIVSFGAAGIIALTNEYIQLKKLHEWCKKSGESACVNHHYWANEDAYNYSNETCYYRRKAESLQYGIVAGSLGASVVAAVVYVINKDSELAFKAFSGAAYKIYWWYMFAACCERKIEYF